MDIRESLHFDGLDVEFSSRTERFEIDTDYEFDLNDEVEVGNVFTFISDSDGVICDLVNPEIVSFDIQSFVLNENANFACGSDSYDVMFDLTFDATLNYSFPEDVNLNQLLDFRVVNENQELLENVFFGENQSVTGSGATFSADFQKNIEISFPGGSVEVTNDQSSIALELRSANVYSFDSTQFDFRLRRAQSRLEFNSSSVVATSVACRLNDEKTIRSNDLLLNDNSCEFTKNLDSGTPGAWKLFEFDYESFVEQYLIIEGVSMVEDFGSVLLYHGPVDEDGFIDLTSGSSADTIFGSYENGELRFENVPAFQGNLSVYTLLQEIELTEEGIGSYLDDTVNKTLSIHTRTFDRSKIGLGIDSNENYGCLELEEVINLLPVLHLQIRYFDPTDLEPWSGAF